MMPLHGRMPGIVEPRDYEIWLTPGSIVDYVLKPYPGRRDGDVDGQPAGERLGDRRADAAKSTMSVGTDKRTVVSVCAPE
jgi:putative SOS response-associated peptidase YedK